MSGSAGAALQLVSYNIRKGKGASGVSRTAFGGVCSALADLSADIVLVQEAFHSRGGELHQTDELASALGFYAYYEPNKQRRVGHHGNATLSRHAASTVANHDISTNRIERRGALYARLHTPIGPVHVLNVHLGLNQAQRRKQVRAIGEILRERVPRKEPTVVAGDFNDWNLRMDAVVRQELDLINAFGELAAAPRTWPAQRPVFNLDRVYVRNLRPSGGRALSGRPWSGLSDHLPLVVELARNRP